MSTAWRVSTPSANPNLPAMCSTIAVQASRRIISAWLRMRAASGSCDAARTKSSSGAVRARTVPMFGRLPARQCRRHPEHAHRRAVRRRGPLRHDRRDEVPARRRTDRECRRVLAARTPAHGVDRGVDTRHRLGDTAPTRATTRIAPDWSPSTVVHSWSPTAKRGALGYTPVIGRDDPSRSSRRNRVQLTQVYRRMLAVVDKRRDRPLT